MKYLRAKWHHDFDDEPIELLSEIDSDRNEIRKVEIFRNGRLGYASNHLSTGTTMLSLTPLPKLSEIATDPQFEVFEISESAFESVWLKATKTGT